VDEQGGLDVGFRIPQALTDRGPPRDAIHGGGAEPDAEVAILLGDRIPGALAAEQIGPGDKAREQAAVVKMVPEPFPFRARTGIAGEQMFPQVILRGEDVVAREHGLDGLGVALGDPEALGVFIEDVDMAGMILTPEQRDGEVGVTEIQGREPFRATWGIEVRCEDVGLRPEVLEILACGKIPEALPPSAILPAGEGVEGGFVIRVDERVILNAGRDEARIGLDAGLVRGDKFFKIPLVADATGIGGGIDPRPPVGFGSATTGGDVLVFAASELGGFLDADDVVFQTEVSIDIFLALVMAEDDLRAVGEKELSARHIELMREALEETLTKAVKIFEVGLTDLAEEQTLQSGDALTVVGTKLGEQPVGFTPAARAAITNGLGSGEVIAQPGGGAGGELAVLENQADVGKVQELVAGTAALNAQMKEALQLFLVGFRQGVRCGHVKSLPC